jgi:tryptophan synthase alpha subunit
VIDSGASAAIVGSRFAQIVEQNLDDGHTMLRGLRECAHTLKGGTLPSGATD